jgi:hypothetical protein
MTSATKKPKSNRRVGESAVRRPSPADTMSDGDLELLLLVQRNLLAVLELSWSEAESSGTWRASPRKR